LGRPSSIKRYNDDDGNSAHNNGKKTSLCHVAPHLAILKNSTAKKKSEQESKNGKAKNRARGTHSRMSIFNGMSVLDKAARAIVRLAALRVASQPFVG